MRHIPEQTAKPGAPALRPAVAELRALAHPLRLRVLEVFAQQPRTTKQVAVLLGEPPTRLYHHVAALERAGLLRLTETRKNRGTTEKWYEAVARSFEDPPPSEWGRRGKGSPARRALAMAVLERSRQELVGAMQRRRHERPLLGRIVLLGSRARIGEVRKELYRTVKRLQRESARFANTHPDVAEHWALTLTFVPVSETKPRRKLTIRS
jgi:DNA-binding transcriptional ArsR family regulator